MALETELELNFAGALRIISGKSRLTVKIHLLGDQDDYERICTRVADYVSDRIPYSILRNGQNLAELIKSGEKVRNKDSLTIVPLILGG